jgi:hypothetical protein
VCRVGGVLSPSRTIPNETVRRKTVSVPFEVLVEYAASLTEEDLQEDMGHLAARAGTFPERLADAMVAARLVRLSPVEIRASMHPAVRRAVDADRSGVASGAVTSFFTQPEIPLDLA